jgi:ABC-2 type transport system permease protein
MVVTSLWKRELLGFMRQRSRVIGVLGMPLILWLFLGSGLGSSFQVSLPAGEINYLQYFFPGTLLMVVLFTTIFSSFSTIDDRNQGFLLSVLVAPVSRSAIVLGKILGAATLAFLQGFLLILLAPALGISLNPAKLAVLAVVLFFVSVCLAGLGFATAWRTETTQGYHSIMNVVLIPMWLLSGAVFPASGAFSWVRWVMTLNPLTYTLSALRHVLYETLPGDGTGSPSLAVSLLVTLVFGLVVFGISFKLVQRGRIVGVG